MREQMLDVDLVIQRNEVIVTGGFEALLPELMRQMRNTALLRVEEAGGELRNTVEPQLVVSEGQSPFLGDVFMLSTRWVCDVPEGALTPAER